MLMPMTWAGGDTGHPGLEKQYGVEIFMFTLWRYWHTRTALPHPWKRNAGGKPLNTQGKV